MFKKCFKTIIAFVFCAIITASTSVAGMGMVEHTQVEKEENVVAPCYDIDFPIIKG